MLTFSSLLSGLTALCTVLNTFFVIGVGIGFRCKRKNWALPWGKSWSPLIWLLLILLSLFIVMVLYFWGFCVDARGQGGKMCLQMLVCSLAPFFFMCGFLASDYYRGLQAPSNLGFWSALLATMVSFGVVFLFMYTFSYDLGYRNWGLSGLSGWYLLGSSLVLCSVFYFSSVVISGLLLWFAFWCYDESIKNSGRFNSKNFDGMTVNGKVKDIVVIPIWAGKMVFLCFFLVLVLCFFFG